MSTTPPDDLVAAIKGYSSDPRIQEALLFGSYAESTWTQDASGTGGGGYFGFTGSQWPAGITTAPAAEQVAVIGPSYTEAVAGTSTPGQREIQATGQAGVPSNLTGAARTEFITIAAEGDYGDITDLSYIAQNNTPSPTYNDFYNNSVYLPPNQVESVYQQITGTLGQPGNGSTSTTTTASSTGTVSGGPGNSGLSATSGNRETNPQAVAYAKSMLTQEASAQPGFGNQAATAIAQTTNPFVTATKPNDPSKSASGWLTDAIGLLTFGSLAQTGGPVTLVRNTLDTDANAAATIAGTTESNIWSIVTSGLVRIGIGVVGLMFVAAGLYLLVTHFGGGATPVPIPV